MNAANPVIEISGLSKIYDSGHQALDNVQLDIERGEIFALLGPNGAGKTTLIGSICGLVNFTQGSIRADGFDVSKQYRQARSRIGLVPQELCTESFETVLATVNFSRGLFGKGPDKAYIQQLLTDLSLWDKRDARILELSGGMKRRVMIAKALSHQPSILFLDEPTAGVDVELRRDMWQMVSRLRENGVTIILTTHYIEEAEEMADRIGIINKGKLMMVDSKQRLMQRLGKRQLTLHLNQSLDSIPAALANFDLALSQDGLTLNYQFDSQNPDHSVADLLRKIEQCGIDYRDLHSAESSLEDIFVNLVRQPA